MAPCAGCRQYFHKKCFDEHLCGNALLPSGEKSPQFGPISRKRPAALDTTGFRPPDYRDVRQHLDIDSDNSEDERQPLGCLPSLPASSSEPAPPVSVTGQQLLSSSLSSSQVLPASSLVPANSSPTPFSSFSSLPAPAPGKRKKRSSRIGVTSAELDVEMLQRELTMAQTKIVSLENTAEELKVSKSLLAQRVHLFEQRESDRNYSHYFPPTAAPSPASTCPSSTGSNLAVCCPSSSLHLKELHSLQSQVFELQSQVTMLATSLSGNQSKTSNISLGDEKTEHSTGNDIQINCPNPIPGSVDSPSVSDEITGNIASPGSNLDSITAASAEHDQIT